MAWIESHQELARHPKSKRLARALDVSVPAAVGHLHFLWWWAYDYAKDGNLDRFTPEDIADAIAWDGEPHVAMSALIDAGFIDSDLRIHDWDEYVGDTIRKRGEDAARKRRARLSDRPQEVQRTSAGHDEDVSPPSEVPDQTRPNQTNPGERETNAHAREAAADAAADSDPAATAPTTPAEVMALWNRVMPPLLSRADKLTPDRRQHLRQRIGADRRRDLSWWETYFAQIRGSPFLRGENDRGWRASLDWAIKNEHNVTRVLEGAYEPAGGGTDGRAYADKRGARESASQDHRPGRRPSQQDWDAQSDERLIPARNAPS